MYTCISMCCPCFVYYHPGEFIHLGTTREYLNYCLQSRFKPNGGHPLLLDAKISDLARATISPQSIVEKSDVKSAGLRVSEGQSSSQHISHKHTPHTTQCLKP